MPFFAYAFMANGQVNSDSIKIEEENFEKAFSADFSYKGDISSNFYGGLRHGEGYLGLGTLGLEFSTERAGLWKGGTFRVSGSNTHGRLISEELVGCEFAVDNIEASTRTYLAELRFSQVVGKFFDFSVGLQEFNTNFDMSEGSSYYVNSSMGVNSVISANVPTSTFPQTTLGLELGLNLSERWRWQACVYDGAPLSEEDNPYNYKWSVSKEHGFMVATEVHFKSADVAALKFGTFYHTDLELFGLYGLYDQRFSDMVSSFARVAYSPSDDCNVRAMIDAGINFHCIFAKRYEDVLGVGFVSNFKKQNDEYEMVMELMYKYQILSGLYVQPDVQFVFNPLTEGASSKAVLGLLRIGIDL